MFDRRLVAADRAMAVVLAFEESRGARITDTHCGDDGRLRAILTRSNVVPPGVASADLISELDGETRIIEVKGRGSVGPVSVIERELDTMISAASCAWLYVVWNTTQPHPYRLVLVNDPQRLPWVKVRNAEREAGAFRGARHEAVFECPSSEIDLVGVEASLEELALPLKG